MQLDNVSDAEDEAAVFKEKGKSGSGEISYPAGALHALEILEPHEFSRIAGTGYVAGITPEPQPPSSCA
jgi:hypothetical protein